MRGRDRESSDSVQPIGAELRLIGVTTVARFQTPDHGY